MALMDTYDWLIRLVFHIEAQFEYISLSYIYWYYFTVYSPAVVLSPNACLT